LAALTSERYLQVNGKFPTAEYTNGNMMKELVFIPHPLVS